MRSNPSIAKELDKRYAITDEDMEFTCAAIRAGKLVALKWVESKWPFRGVRTISAEIAKLEADDD